MVLLLSAVLIFASPASAGRSLLERARAQDPEDVPFLREALAGARVPDRAQAAFALGQYGLIEVDESAKDAAVRFAAAEVLVPAAMDPDPGVRRQVVESLGKVGGKDEEIALLAAATDIDPGVRGAAALAFFRMRLLKRIPEYSTATATKLSILASDSDAEVRWRAAYAVSRWPEPRLTQVMTLAQRDADLRVRLFSARSLGKLGVAPDVALLSDTDPYVRAEAVASFSSAKAWERLPDKIFGDPSAHVRAAAADAAAASGDGARFGPLVEKLAGGVGTLAPGRALIALAKLRGDSASEVLSKARRDPRWWIRARAFEASTLLSMGGQILREGVADPDPRVASQALESLAASSSPVVVEALDHVLRDPKSSLELRGTAVDAAAERGDLKLYPALLESMKTAKGTGAGELRESIRKALLETARKNPEISGSIQKELKNFPVFTDKPKRFRPLKEPASVEMETEKGTFSFELLPEAGVHSAAFVESVKKGFYDGLTWHRVVTGFVVQGGDPRGSGWGDAGWRLADEITQQPFLRGTVGMPKAGKDTGGCQLFVSLAPAPHLDGRYTPFGLVNSGLDVLDLLEPGDKILRARLK